MTTGNYDIPFDRDGNQLSYPERWQKPVWLKNHEFNDILEFADYGRGRSAVTFTMKRGSGTTVNFFVSDFCDIVKHMQYGRIVGTFTFSKRGANYGCRLVKTCNGEAL